jgi:hypothetical protein
MDCSKQNVETIYKLNDDESPVKLSHEDLDKQNRLADLEQKREHLRSDIQDREERKKFATRVYYLVSFFLAISILVLVISGTSRIDLSDNVMITFLSTTTVNVIGIFAIVMRYLFKM